MNFKKIADTSFKEFNFVWFSLNGLWTLTSGQFIGPFSLCCLVVTRCEFLNSLIAVRILAHGCIVEIHIV